MRGLGDLMGARRHHRGRLGVATLAIALGSLGAGCSAVHQSLGPSDSACYVALPTASAAVGQSGHLNGVRLMKVSALGYPRLAAALQRAGVDSGRVCLVAFEGNFSSSSVSHPSDRSSGRLAVVVLRYPGGQLVATVLFSHFPVHFGHTHLG